MDIFGTLEDWADSRLWKKLIRADNEGKGNEKTLIKALRHKSEFYRVKAAGALRKIGSRRAVGPLILLLQHEELGSSTRIKSSVAWTLGEIGDPAAIETLISLLDDWRKCGQETIAEVAAEALLMINKKSAVNIEKDTLQRAKKIVAKIPTLRKQREEQREEEKKDEEKHSTRSTGSTGGDYNKGIDKYQLGEFKAAIKYFDYALDASPNYSPPWRGKGWAFKGLGRFREALQCFETALAIETGTHSSPELIADYLYGKGYALYKLGRNKEAVEILSEFINMGSRFPKDLKSATEIVSKIK